MGFYAESEVKFRKVTLDTDEEGYLVIKDKQLSEDIWNASKQYDLWIRIIESHPIETDTPVVPVFKRCLID
jgi:hypothetical protein